MNTLLYGLMIRYAVLISMLFILLSVQLIRAETSNCTAITTVPTFISTQGIYCLTGNLTTSMTSGNAITINVNNVTIDMNGFKLGGLGAGDVTNANGIYAYQRKNITIRNGIIRGFRYGIYFPDATPYTTSQGHLIEDILVDQNTSRGIYVMGRGMTLRRNRIVDTGGSTFSIGTAYGISVVGPGNKAINNDVTTVVATAGGTDDDAFGILFYAATDSVVQDNRVVDIQGDGTRFGFGIYLVNSSNQVTVRGNTIVTSDYGIFYSGSTGVYKDNVTDNIAITQYTNGTDGGGNI